MGQFMRYHSVIILTELILTLKYSNKGLVLVMSVSIFMCRGSQSTHLILRENRIHLYMVEIYLTLLVDITAPHPGISANDQF